MEFLSPYLVAIAFAWLLSQGLKYLIIAVKKRSFSKSLRQLYLSGSMPSAHSASVMALLVVIGYKDGFDTPLFALAALFGAIVMYDAMMVRRSSGEQGKAITEVIKTGKLSVDLPRVAEGHTPLEVFVGALVGFAVGTVVIIATL